jgi:anti-sigma-K factor RskA
VSCEQVIESGAYVLGILDPDDRIAYERHLATCAICQREVADFADLPDMLAQLGPDEVEAIGTSAGVPPERTRIEGRVPPRFEAPFPLRPLPSVPRSNPEEQFQPYSGGRLQQRGMQRRQRRWRAVTAGLAAAACLAVGALVGARFIDYSPAPRPPAMVAMNPVADSVPITAQVALTPFAGGTEVRMHCVYNGGTPGPRWSLQMVVYPKNGEAPERLSTWTAAHGDDVTLTAATRFAPAQIGKVEIRKGDSTSLLVYEQA